MRPRSDQAASLGLECAPPSAVSRTQLPERNLDVLRSVAVLLVLLAHLIKAHAWIGDELALWRIGQLGVLLFFVHTSLVLMSSLERQGDRPDWVFVFYLRRALRIYPVCIVVVIVTTALSVPPHVATPLGSNVAVTPTFRELFSNLALVQNLSGDRDLQGVLWSLPIEVQMYLLLPIAYLIARRSIAGVGLMILGLGALGLVVAHSSLPGMWLLSMMEYGPCFGAGVLAYAVLRSGRSAGMPAWFWIVVLPALFPLFWLLGPNPSLPERAWPLCLAVGLAVPLARELPDTWLTRAAHRICTFSYGIYLLHVPVIWLAFDVLRRADGRVQWGVFAVGIVALPVLAYYGIERPCIEFGKRLVARSHRLPLREQRRESRVLAQ